MSTCPSAASSRSRTQFPGSHPGPCLWEYKHPLPPHNNGAEATFLWKTDSSVETPDLQAVVMEYPLVATSLAVPLTSWGVYPLLVRPRSRGRVRITGPRPSDSLEVNAGTFSDPADIEAMIRAIQICREVGHSSSTAPFTKRELVPGNLLGAELERFVRQATSSCFHQSGTAKMGHDEMSVVDNQLRVHGTSNLRVADASIMPRVTTGNPMAPCAIIGEKAAELLKARHGLEEKSDGA
jgi:choline dehydrogenase